MRVLGQIPGGCGAFVYDGKLHCLTGGERTKNYLAILVDDTVRVIENDATIDGQFDGQFDETFLLPIEVVNTENMASIRMPVLTKHGIVGMYDYNVEVADPETYKLRIFNDHEDIEGWIFYSNGQILLGSINPVTFYHAPLCKILQKDEVFGSYKSKSQLANVYAMPNGGYLISRQEEEGWRLCEKCSHATTFIYLQSEPPEFPNVDDIINHGEYLFQERVCNCIQAYDMICAPKGIQYITDNTLWMNNMSVLSAYSYNDVVYTIDMSDPRVVGIAQRLSDEKDYDIYPSKDEEIMYFTLQNFGQVIIVCDFTYPEMNGATVAAFNFDKKYDLVKYNEKLFIENKNDFCRHQIFYVKVGQDRYIVTEQGEKLDFIFTDLIHHIGFSDFEENSIVEFRGMKFADKRANDDNINIFDYDEYYFFEHASFVGMLILEYNGQDESYTLIYNRPPPAIMKPALHE
jgi:hypothetical protein